MRRRVLLAFEAAEREADADDAAPAADVRDRRRRADRRRAGRRARRDRAAVAAQGLPPHPPGVGAHRAARGRPVRAARRSRAAARRGARARSSGSASRCGPASVVTGVDDDGVTIGAERIAAGTVLWAAGVAASPLAQSLGVPLDRAGRVHAEPTLARARPSRDLRRRRPVRVRSRTASRCPAWRRSRCRRARTPRRTCCARSRGEPLEPFRYHDYGNMATIGRGAAVGDVFGLKIVRLPRLAVLALPAHLLADRLPQPPRRDDRVGVGLLHVPAPRPADHRRLVRILQTLTLQLLRSSPSRRISIAATFQAFPPVLPMISGGTRLAWTM